MDKNIGGVRFKSHATSGDLWVGSSYLFPESDVPKIIDALTEHLAELEEAARLKAIEEAKTKLPTTNGAVIQGRNTHFRYALINGRWERVDGQKILGQPYDHHLYKVLFDGVDK